MGAFSNVGVSSALYSVRLMMVIYSHHYNMILVVPLRR